MSSKTKEHRFEELVSKYHRLVWHLIGRYYGGALVGERGEDLYQDIWTKLWTQFKKNESNVVNFKSYLYRTVQTTMWDAMRDLEKKPYEDEVNEGLTPDSGQREEAVHAGLDVAYLLTSLSEDDARMMRAHMQGFDYQEIADLLGTTEASIRNKISRTKKKLGKQYGTFAAGHI